MWYIGILSVVATSVLPERVYLKGKKKNKHSCSAPVLLESNSSIGCLERDIPCTNCARVEFVTEFVSPTLGVKRVSVESDSSIGIV